MVSIGNIINDYCQNHWSSQSHGTCHSVGYTSQADWICDEGYEDDGSVPCGLKVEDNSHDVDIGIENYQQISKNSIGYPTLVDIYDQAVHCQKKSGKSANKNNISDPQNKIEKNHLF